jgi:quinoprotein glucose dehydrogenase
LPIGQRRTKAEISAIVEKGAGRYPAVAPPWGTLNAINLHTGDLAWRILSASYPELAAKRLADTGTENYGGPIVTAGGLDFIGATNFDRKFRAFDATGALLRTKFPGQI